MFNSLNRGLAAAANRGLAAAAHMARLNQRRAMASMAKQKEDDEVMNWTCDDVIEWARPLFSAKNLDVDALKAAQLDGESLLEMRKNQNLMNALMRDGLKPTVVHKLAAAARELVAPEPKTIFIALSEVEGQGSRITIKDQKNMDQVRQDFRAGGFIDCSSGPDGEVVVRQIEELTGGHTYRMSYDRTDRLTRMEGKLKVVEGTQKNASDALEDDAHKSLQSLLEEEYQGVIVLDANRVLLPKTPDGVFLVDVNTPEPTLWIMEAKRHLTNQYDDAKEQLHGYKEAASVKFPLNSVVMVMAGYCCDDTAAKAATAGFKVLQQNGTQFTLRG